MKTFSLLAAAAAMLPLSAGAALAAEACVCCKEMAADATMTCCDKMKSDHTPAKPAPPTPAPSPSPSPSPISEECRRSPPLLPDWP